MFTVIIPYYKKRAYIERCIDSVLNQTFKQFEIILIDDGSQDDIAILIAEKYFGLVNLIQQPNLGVSVARNAGISAAKMPYIAFLDADDCWLPQFLQFANEIIINNSAVKIIGAHYTSDINVLKNNYQQNNYVEIKNYFKIAIKNTLFITSATIINSKYFLEHQGFNPLLKRGQDREVWFRVIASGGKAFYINNTMLYYSQEDPNQATSSIGKVENSFIGNINTLYKPLLQENENSDFSKFITKLVYFDLFPYYFSPENHARSKLTLQQNKHYFFLLHLPYYLPLAVGQKIVSNKKMKQYLRFYFKLLYRTIY